MKPKKLKQIKEKFEFTNANTKQSKFSQNKSSKQARTLFSKRLECQNNGQELSLKKIEYLCNDESVSKETYSSLELCVQDKQPSTVNCNDLYQRQCLILDPIKPTLKIQYSVTDACYCPADYDGEYCTQKNVIKCSIVDNTYQEILKNCKDYDEFYYVSSYGGIPPCEFKNSGDNINFNFTIDCQNEYPQSLKEGIKVNYYYEPVDQYILDELAKKIKYHINEPNRLVVSKDTQFTLQTAIINWSELDMSLNYITDTMSEDIILKKQNFEFNISLHDELFKDKAYNPGGRFQIESQVRLLIQDSDNGDKNSSYSSTIAQGQRSTRTVENNAFKEDFGDSDNIFLTIILPIILSLAVIICLILAYLYYVHKIRQNNTELAEGSPIRNQELQSSINDRHY